MKVKEPIERLQRFDPGLDICVRDHDWELVDAGAVSMVGITRDTSGVLGIDHRSTEKAVYISSLGGQK